MSIFTSQPGALRGNFMCDSCGAGWQGACCGMYVRMAPIANWPQNKHRQTTSPKQTRTISRRGKLIKNKTPAGNWLPPFTGLAGRTGPGHIAHWFYLLIRTLCCFYLIFMPAAISISVIELSLSRQLLVVLAPGKGEELWLVLVGRPVVHLSTFWRLACPVPLSTRSHIEACQKWFCAWLALANTQRYTKWWTSTATPMPDTSLKRVVVASEAGRGKLEVVIHWQIDSIDAGTKTLLQYNFQ